MHKASRRFRHRLRTASGGWESGANRCSNSLRSRRDLCTRVHRHRWSVHVAIRRAWSLRWRELLSPTWTNRRYSAELGKGSGGVILLETGIGTTTLAIATDFLPGRTRTDGNSIRSIRASRCPAPYWKGRSGSSTHSMASINTQSSRNFRKARMKTLWFVSVISPGSGEHYLPQHPHY